ncbi:ATP-binding cassette domain-containing protein, partial [Thermodesulfobacteriota bacterium]
MSNDDQKIIYSMIKVSKNYNNRPVLKNISLSYFYGAKIGVLGLNGSGKSTLLRILAGIDSEFDGRTVLAPGHTIDYLEQEPLLDPEKTVKQIVEEGVDETLQLIAEFNNINEQFAEPMSDDEMQALIDKQADVQEKLDSLSA